MAIPKNTVTILPNVFNVVTNIEVNILKNLKTKHHRASSVRLG